MSRYTGKTATAHKQLAYLFRKWLKNLTNAGVFPVDKAVLVKTWSEEVFIEVTSGDMTRRYYFDLVVFIMGTISLY
jgi:hypothetical protein